MFGPGWLVGGAMMKYAPPDYHGQVARFIHERAAPAFTRHLAKARAVQAVVREHAYGATETLIAWWDAGVHPAQLEGWDRAEMRGRDSTA